MRSAIVDASPIGTVAVEPEFNDRGEREIWLEPHILAKLKALRGPGESYSDAILKLAEDDQLKRSGSR